MKSEIRIESQLDAIDALDHTASMLRGLGFLCIALCECPSVIDDDVCGLIADLVYYCSDVEKKASGVLYAEFRKANGLSIEGDESGSESQMSALESLKHAA